MWSRFVYGKKLTGLTQYNELVYFPTLSLQKDKILTSIASFFTNELLPKLTTLHNYVIDFILVENGDSFNVCILSLFIFNNIILF